jgi:fatty-acid desaturase
MVERYQLAAGNAAGVGSVQLEVRAVEYWPLVAALTVWTFLVELSERGVIVVALVALVGIVAIALGYHRR